MTSSSFPIRSDAQLKDELLAHLLGWLKLTETPSPEALKTVTSAVSARVTLLRAQYQSFGTLARKGNRVKVQQRAAIHQELQVLVPALRYLRGVTGESASPWARLRKHLLVHGFGLPEKVLREPIGLSRFERSYKPGHTPLHGRIACELLQALGLPFPEGLSENASVFNWLQRKRDFDLVQRGNARMRLYAKLATLAPVREALSAQEFTLLIEVFGLQRAAA